MVFHWSYVVSYTNPTWAIYWLYFTADFALCRSLIKVLLIDWLRWEEQHTTNSRRWRTRYELPTTPKTRSPTVFILVRGTTRLLAEDDLSCLRVINSSEVLLCGFCPTVYALRTLNTGNYVFRAFKLKLTKKKRHKTSLIPHTLTLRL